MKYKLYTEEKYNSPIEQVLRGRGIDDVRGWLDADMSIVSPFSALKNIDLAVDMLKRHIDDDNNVLILVDCDVDGYTSAAILINFLYSLYPKWINNHLDYIHHTGKQHGLADIMQGEEWKNYDLIICPDSSSNDYEQHEQLLRNGEELIILDHHEAPHISESKNTITVNNQLCDYPNKDFSGAGIVWQFCRAYNSINNVEGELSTDLCALGL